MHALLKSAATLAAAFGLSISLATAGLAQVPTYLTQWGSQGAGNAQFNYPQGIAVDNTGIVYVTDLGRVQKFTNSGEFLGQWSPPYGGQYFSGVAADAARNVYVADISGLTISKWDPSGVLLGHWVVVGSGPSSLYGLATDLFGHVYACDTGRSYIRKYDSVGTLLASWGGVHTPYGVATDAAGNVYVADTGNLRIVKLDGEGNLLTTWGASAQAVGVGPTGLVYVAGRGGFEMFTSVGGYLGRCGLSGAGNEQSAFLRAIAIDAAGNVFVVDTGNNRVVKFGTSATPATQASWGRIKSLYR